MGMFSELYRYRSFIISSIKNDLINRFSRSKLGGLWAILNPLSQVAIYALILSNVLSAKLPGIDNKYAYSIYLMAGLLAWNLFNEVILRSLNMFIDNGDLMKKMQFPKATIPSIVGGVNFVNNILLFLAMLIIFFLLGHGFSLNILWLIPFSLLLLIFSLGIGLILGVLNVFIRDIGQVIPILLQVLFWFTPIAYPISIIPEQYRYLLKFNPISYFTGAYQEILAYNRVPNISELLLLLTIAIIIIGFGVFLFRRASAEMVDVL
ncbi:ABC transporter permease [Testudinibacter sp. TR-2022]|uniref:ABC transporter permease n=1 Tax=Testudinibacter sp. TR-2022 TaxID=2585029 RepID=UPI0022790C01|nr:ABC transporter permease [Testudinibacter sp. TR-2022]